MQTPEFKKWHKLKTAYILQGIENVERAIEKQVDEMMKPKNLKIEYLSKEE